MRPPRLQLFELEDFAWFPGSIRDYATDYLIFIESHFALHEPVVPLLRDMVRRSNATDVIDLCSGAGGPAAAVYRALAAQETPVRLTLTDKYPNLSAFQRLSESHDGRIAYLAGPVDAIRAPRELTGIRTMFNSFHHFAPRDARSILQCAVEARQPVGIFEITDRSLAMVLGMFLTPLVVALATPFMRPFRWTRLLWTYALPIVPLTCFWDGFVSQLRAYTPAEMLDLARGLDGYEWKAATVRLPAAPARITYLIGMPR